MTSSEDCIYPLFCKTESSTQIIGIFVNREIGEHQIYSKIREMTTNDMAELWLEEWPLDCIATQSNTRIVFTEDMLNA